MWEYLETGKYLGIEDCPVRDKIQALAIHIYSKYMGSLSVGVFLGRGNILVWMWRKYFLKKSI
jgi:hypothetical protein